MFDLGGTVFQEAGFSTTTLPPASFNASPLASAAGFDGVSWANKHGVTNPATTAARSSGLVRRTKELSRKLDRIKRISTIK
jgi:hypothetical protein